MRKALGLLLLLGGWLVAAVVAAGPASAHAELVSSDPANGQRLDQGPTTITLKFSESVSPDAGFVRVFDAQGKRLDTGAPAHPDGATVTVDIRSGLGTGAYVVSWRVTSADSHPISGAYSFAVGDAVPISPSTVDTPTGSGGPVGTTFTVVRWVGFAGLVLLGGVVFLTACWRDGRTESLPRRLVWTGWGLTAGSTITGLLLEGPYSAGTGLGDLFRSSLLDATLRTTYGRMLSLRLVLLAVLAIVLVRLLSATDDPPWLEDAGTLTGLAVLATFGGSGHAVAGLQAPIAVFSDTAHLAAMSAWLGGLVLIALQLLRRREALTSGFAAALPRFSTLAMISVSVLVVTGTYRSWREIGSWDALFGSTYGRIVIIKVGLLAVLLLLGNAGRLWVRRLSTVDEPAAPRVTTLRKSVGAELAIGVVVLAFTSVLVAQPPARSSFFRPYNDTLALPTGDQVKVTVTPAKAGGNEVDVDVLGKDGRAKEAQDVQVTADLPGSQYERLPVSLTKAAPGQYRGYGVSLPTPGRWQLDIQVRTSEFDSYRVVAAVSVR